MKTLIALCIIVILISLFSGCFKQPENAQTEQNKESSAHVYIPPPPDFEENAEVDIELYKNAQTEIVVVVEPDNISIDNITDTYKIKIINLSDDDYLCGVHHKIEYFDGNDWVLATAVGYFDIGFSIESGKALLLNAARLKSPYDSANGFNYVPGKYRVNSNDFYGEFTIS